MDILGPVLLVATFRIEADKIVLKYSIENKSGAEIFLVNHLTQYEDGKGWIPDSKVVYVAVDDNGKVELSKRVPPMPENRLVTPRDFYVTPLPDGDRLEEELELPLPLRENRPYDALIEPIPEPQDLDALLTFSLGYFQSLPYLEAKKVEVHGVPAYDLVLRSSDADAQLQSSKTDDQQSGLEMAPTEHILKSESVKAKLQVISLPKRKGK